MKVLKSIKLINFQSHKDTLIEFAGPGCLTVITGPSDNGKSAVIRALRWVFYNVPQGDGFIFNAEDKCSVTLEYDDGTIVKRMRSRGGVNRYIVNGQTFEGFGNGVPLEVQQATGIRKLEIGDQSFLLNLSEQLDGPFLGKSVSGPARAKVLGKLAGTEEIDYAGKEIGTDLYRAKKQKEILERDIEKLREQISRYWFIHEWEKTVMLVEIILREIKAKMHKVDQLKNLSAAWNDVAANVTELKTVVAGLQEVDMGLTLVQAAQDNLFKGNRLCTFRSAHFEAVTESKRSRETLDRLGPVFKYAEPIINAMTEKDLEAIRLAELCVRYDLLEFNVFTLRKRTERLSVIDDASNSYSLAEYENNLMDTLEVLKEQHERIGCFVLSQKGIKAGLDGIDIADDLLRSASKDHLQLLKARESQRQRTIHVQSISQSLQQLGKLANGVNRAEADYLDFMTSLGRCPTCGGDIKIEKLQEVIWDG